MEIVFFSIYQNEVSKEYHMKHFSTIVTLSVALISVVGITMFTHYMVTQIPQEIQFNIDAVVALKDVNAFDNTGFTPLMRAAIDSNVTDTKILLEKGANPNIASANADRAYPLTYALVNGGKIGSLAVAQLLIESGADVNVTDARQMAPIHNMMMVTNADNRWKILELLMQHGAQINAQDEDGSTMLHITASMNDLDWVTRVNNTYGQILNYDLKNKDGHTPIELAVKLGHVSLNDSDAVEGRMLKRPALIGADGNARAMDEYGRTGLQLAVIRSDMKFTKGLLGDGIDEKGNPIRISPIADIAHQDIYGNTALHYAMTNLKPLTYVQYLLSKGAPVNIVNQLGQTPLFWVFKIKQPGFRRQVAQLLLEKGSPIANKDKTGQTVIDVARQVQDEQLYNLFKQALLNKQK